MNWGRRWWHDQACGTDQIGFEATETSPLGLAADPPVARHQSSCRLPDLALVLLLQVSGARVGRRNFEATEPPPIELATTRAHVGRRISCRSSLHRSACAPPTRLTHRWTPLHSSA
jgi:hypothetical protein